MKGARWGRGGAGTWRNGDEGCGGGVWAVALEYLTCAGIGPDSPPLPRLFERGRPRGGGAGRWRETVAKTVGERR